MVDNDTINITDLIKRISVKLRQQADQLASNNHISAQQARAITYIHNHQAKGVIQKDLARISGRRSASITHMIKDLEAKGFITRQTVASDERQKNLFVTNFGRRIALAYKRTAANFNSRVVHDLTSAEQKQLKQLLNRIDESL